MALLVVVGPTGSGKTELAVQLAEHLGGEVVSADSVQLYRGFDIGSGKPTSEELARAPHHLVGTVEPLAPMDAARWAELAEAAIHEIRGRGKVPIVCGGTFLYVRALLFGLAPAPPADDGVRERHRRIAEQDGRCALYDRLRRVDPVTALRLDPNDLVRVSRALEVYELSGVPMCEWQSRHGFREPRHAARLLGVGLPRDELNQRISRRVEGMLNAGWVEEVRGLIAAGYRQARAMQAVGYRQVAAALEQPGDVDQEAIEEAICRATRIYARRQRTWLRRQPVQWIEPGTEIDVLANSLEANGDSPRRVEGST